MKKNSKVKRTPLTFKVLNPNIIYCKSKYMVVRLYKAENEYIVKWHFPNTKYKKKYKWAFMFLCDAKDYCETILECFAHIARLDRESAERQIKDYRFLEVQ